MRALYFGTYDREHPRNINAIAAMTGAGVDVTERQVPLRRGGVLGALDIFAAETKLTVPRRRDFDVVIVGYPGHFDVPRARRVARKRPLVFDAVLSLEDELVEVRRRFRPRSTAATVLRVVDSRALRLPDLVVCGTRAEAVYLEQLGARRTAVIFLGADENVFCETWSPAYPFSALYVADASRNVVEAAALLVPDVPVVIVEPGEIPAGDRGIAFAHAGIVLGSFRESRTIPPAVFEALATGAPVITADTPAARELLDEGASALLVPPEDAEALAGALRRLAGNDELRASLAGQGRQVYAERASRRVLGARWREALEGTVREKP
ncbi:MAG TPA: glycosyltransferase family 4 protein [Gaiellaceae bacterium]|nr:glycosyltransferase family 4 protein [Gaiellaceae bacterium]